MTNLQKKKKIEKTMSSVDVVVIGGSFAGLAAALQLVRTHTSVLVVDGGEPRNRFASQSFGTLGHDGKSASAILSESKAQLARYPSFAYKQAIVTGVTREDGRFVVVCKAAGDEEQAVVVTARRIVLASGVVDELPAVPGLKERWGVSVNACAYCHAFETTGKRQGVLGSPMAAHQVAMLPAFGPTTLFTNGVPEFDPPKPEELEVRHIAIEREPVAELVGEAPNLEGVKLKDGRVVPVESLYVLPTTSLSPLVAQLGVATASSPTGPFVRVDMFNATSVPGCFAAGDVASPISNLALAIGAGTMAGVSCHQSLLREPKQEETQESPKDEKDKDDDDDDK
jgi:thioredoxin reductase